MTSYLSVRMTEGVTYRCLLKVRHINGLTYLLSVCALFPQQLVCGMLMC